jgi:hypothetical protein
MGIRDAPGFQTAMRLARGPVRIGIRARVTVRVSEMDRRDRTPEYVSVLGVPTCDPRIRHSQIQQGEQVRVLPQTEASAYRKIHRNPVPVERRVSSPKQNELRLIIGAERA